MPSTDYIAGLRRRIGHDLLLVPGVAAVVQDPAGRVLVQRRVDDGRWEVPGGLIDPGEQPAQAVVRELREETGLLVRPTRVLSVQTYPEHRYPHGDLIQCVVTAFAADLVGGELGGGELGDVDDEAAEHRFVDADELSRLDVGAGGLRSATATAFAWDEAWLRRC